MIAKLLKQSFEYQSTHDVCMHIELVISSIYEHNSYQKRARNDPKQ